jgi:hypothetical protein
MQIEKRNILLTYSPQNGKRFDISSYLVNHILIYEQYRKCSECNKANIETQNRLYFAVL